MTLLALFAAATIWFNTGEKSFDCHGHDAAAYTLFAAIIGVAALNGVRKFRESPDGGVRPALLNRYAVITILMLAVLVIGLIGMQKDWRYWVLFIEGGVLLLFLVFWFLQSLDLWDRVVRPQEGVRTLLPQPKAPVTPRTTAPTRARTRRRPGHLSSASRASHAAVAEGFEPSVGLPQQTLSRRSP